MASSISLLYPIVSDFERSVERLDPQVYNYFCLHGKQVFACLQRKRYRVLAQGWQPQGCLMSEHCIAGDRHIVVDTSSFQTMIDYFVYSVLELCNLERNLSGD